MSLFTGNKDPKIIQFAQKVYDLHCSAGMAVYGQDTNEIYDLIEYADFAMYKAKQKGKNTYHRFEHADYEKARSGS